MAEEDVDVEVPAVSVLPEVLVVGVLNVVLVLVERVVRARRQRFAGGAGG